MSVGTVAVRNQAVPDILNRERGDSDDDQSEVVSSSSWF